ncbi:hypothetical protein SGRIM128S_01012 [Streptomyces griseomycini]
MQADPGRPAVRQGRHRRRPGRVVRAGRAQHVPVPQVRQRAVRGPLRRGRARHRDQRRAVPVDRHLLEDGAVHRPPARQPRRPGRRAGGREEAPGGRGGPVVRRGRPVQRPRAHRTRRVRRARHDGTQHDARDRPHERQGHRPGAGHLRGRVVPRCPLLAQLDGPGLDRAGLRPRRVRRPVHARLGGLHRRGGAHRGTARRVRSGLRLRHGHERRRRLAGPARRGRPEPRHVPLPGRRARSAPRVRPRSRGRRRAARRRDSAARRG